MDKRIAQGAHYRRLVFAQPAIIDGRVCCHQGIGETQGIAHWPAILQG
jgi:hypothetical protein